MNAIEVRGLEKRYGDVSAVNGISFRVAEGEVFAFLGPNGAGKTTTVEILEGFRPRSSGDISVLGSDPGRSDPLLKARIGIVLQECGIQGEFTVTEAIDIYGSSYPKRIATDRLIDLVELGDKRDTRIKKLSGGQRRRVDLALGLVGDPDLVFLDEPTTGFDPGARRSAWAMIKNLCTLGKTIFLTTHYMEEAQYLADRIAVINHGEIIAEGPPDELGGRQLAATTIRLPLDGEIGAGDLPDLGNANVATSVDALCIETDSPAATLNTLTGWALDRSLTLNEMTVTKPTLEDIYLELVGNEAFSVTDIEEETGG